MRAVSASISFFTLLICVIFCPSHSFIGSVLLITSQFTPWETQFQGDNAPGVEQEWALPREARMKLDGVTDEAYGLG